MGRRRAHIVHYMPGLPDTDRITRMFCESVNKKVKEIKSASLSFANEADDDFEYVVDTN